jgi:hypothetical protein
MINETTRAEAIGQYSETHVEKSRTMLQAFKDYHVQNELIFNHACGA